MEGATTDPLSPNSQTEKFSNSVTAEPQQSTGESADPQSLSNLAQNDINSSPLTQPQQNPFEGTPPSPTSSSSPAESLSGTDAPLAPLQNALEGVKSGSLPSINQASSPPDSISEPLQEKVQAAAPELLLYGAAGVAAVGLTGLAVEVSCNLSLYIVQYKLRKSKQEYAGVPEVKFRSALRFFMLGCGVSARKNV